MLKNILILCCLILLVILYLVITKANNLDGKVLIQKSFKKCLGYIGNANMRLHNKNVQAAKTNKNKTFYTSKFYALIQGIILDLNYTGTTVEGFLTTVVLISIFVNAILFYFLRSIPIFILGTILVSVFIVTFLFMTSSDVFYKRQFDRMDAETLITASLKDGVLKAIQRNVKLFGDSVRQPYLDYIRRRNMKVPAVEALELLAKDLGPESRKYINELIQFEKYERSGSIEIFQDIDRENTVKRTDMLNMQYFLNDLNRNYLICDCIVLAALVLILSSNPVLIKFLFKTFWGNILLMINACIVLYGFARIQSFRNI